MVTWTDFGLGRRLGVGSLGVERLRDLERIGSWGSLGVEGFFGWRDVIGVGIVG